MWPFDLLRRRDPVETRAAGGFTGEALAARADYIHGRRGLAELTATVQACVTLWEAGLGLADVTGTALLDRRALTLMARGLALRGEALFLVRDDGLVAISEWDLATRNGRPRAYRLGVPEAGGTRTETALAAEVLHVVVGASPAQPWVGVPPLRRAPLTAALLHVVEAALTEVYENAPLGSKIVPYPEASEQDLTALARSFVGARGKVVLNESVNVASAGGATPLKDWAPEDLGPDLQRAMTRDTLDAARAGVLAAFGVLPALFSVNGNGPMVRESQRHLAQWGLQPIAALIAEEASAKLGAPVTLDVMRPLQAFDVGGRARAANAIIEALVKAKEAGVDPGTALKLVDWEGAR